MTTATVPTDRAHLARAVALAAGVAGSTGPNPPVGCVLVRDGHVVGEGATAPAGGPHAEAAALTRACERAAGATAYVTLEPCAHHGRTPPCSDALTDAGVVRVVMGHRDPNTVAAGGADRLRQAGIEVDGPLREDDLLHGAITRQLEGFLTVVARGRPHVTLKLAQTVDGLLEPPAPGQWITGPAARTAVHRWRAACDAVLVGSGTILADDPRLDVRRVASACQPIAVVLDARLRTPVDAEVVRPGTVVVTTATAPAERRGALAGSGVRVIDVPPSRTGHGVDLQAALAALVPVGVTSVLAEPGGTLARALVEADLVDRLVLHVAGGPDTSGSPARAVPMPAGGQWLTERSGGAGPDLILHLVPAARLATEHLEVS